MVQVDDLARWFDVSPPLLERLLEGGGRQTVKALDGVSFTVGRGKTVAIVGESGCGKTTLLRLIAGLDTPTRGTISFADGEATAKGRVQMIFQDPYASLNPRWRVRDIIAEPIRYGPRTVPGGESRRRVDELLLLVGLAPADGRKFPHEFSGGQRQRISIARALAGEPDFIVCDEPTSALDVSVQAQILNLMRRLQRERDLTYLFISHDLAVVYHVADAVGVMYLGRICEWSPTRALFDTPRHPYTRLLLDAIPDMAMTDREREPPAGELPNPMDPPSGCAFHPRCPFADDRCGRERPELHPVGDALVACHGVAEGRVPAARDENP